MENDTERIRTGLQQRFCGDSPVAEHIVGVEKCLLIEVDVRKRVQTIKHQIDVVVPELRGRGLEVTDPVPVGETGRRQAFTSDPWGNGIELHQRPQT